MGRAKYTRARANRGDATRRERRKLETTDLAQDFDLSRDFRRSLHVASPRTFARACVYFARPTITIAKIRDYSQSTSILQNRMNKFIEKHDVLNPEQFGFRPNSRTTDCLFTFQQLLHKYTKQHKKLYVGFIDYEKAFDSVWQSGMIHKLQKYGIQGKFLNVIKSMYSSIRSCVKINQNALTELFSCNKGIRQGDGLRPVLFSLFMNDLLQYFKESKSPGVMLGNRTINCLMYAGDLLITSPSPEGLQQSLKVIHRHAQQWKFKVNTKKSNIIIFSGNGQNKNNINFKNNNETLQIVDKQAYLGIEMTLSGRYTYSREILNKTATKFLSIIKRSFYNLDSATVAIKNKLFNALVKPVLLYACEIWGPELLSYKTHFDKRASLWVFSKKSKTRRSPRKKRRSQD